MTAKWNGTGDMFSSGFAKELDRELQRIREDIQGATGNASSLRAVQSQSRKLLEQLTHSPSGGRAIPFERDRLLTDGWKSGLTPGFCGGFVTGFCKEQLHPVSWPKFDAAFTKLLTFVVSGDNQYVRKALADDLELLLEEYLDTRPPATVNRRRTRSSDGVNTDVRRYFRQCIVDRTKKADALRKASVKFNLSETVLGTAWDSEKRQRNREIREFIITKLDEGNSPTSVLQKAMDEFGGSPNRMKAHLDRILADR